MPFFIWFKCFFTFSFLTFYAAHIDARHNTAFFLMFFFLTPYSLLICFSSLQIERYDSMLAFVTLCCCCFGFFFCSLFGWRVVCCIDFNDEPRKLKKKKNDVEMKKKRTPLKSNGRSSWNGHIAYTPTNRMERERKVKKAKKPKRREKKNEKFTFHHVARICYKESRRGWKKHTQSQVFHLETSKNLSKMNTFTVVSDK